MNQPDQRAYIKLALSLAKQIDIGELAPGDRLSIGDLHRKSQHSRQTVGKAMKVLEEGELIYRVPGLGYFISYPS
jgi:DNA-binding GntR family transcriptional regulator